MIFGKSLLADPTIDLNAAGSYRCCGKMPGVDVMITIFRNFLRKNWRFSKKNTVMIKTLHNLPLF
jgi:hypothetical protein